MEHPRTPELRLRRTAKRRGLTVSHNPRRDPLAPDYDQWTITDEHGQVLATERGVQAAHQALNRLSRERIAS